MNSHSNQGLWKEEKSERERRNGSDEAQTPALKISFEWFIFRLMIFIEGNEGSRTRYCMLRKVKILFESFSSD
jgi:hypothetical protein